MQFKQADINIFGETNILCEYNILFAGTNSFLGVRQWVFASPLTRTSFMTISMVGQFGFPYQVVRRLARTARSSTLRLARPHT